MERNRQKLLGRDNGSLTEQQNKGKRNNNDTNKENTQNKTVEPRERLSPTTAAARSQAASPFPATPLPPNRNPV